LKFLADNSSACSTLAPSAPSSTWFLYCSKAIRTNWLRVPRLSYPRALSAGQDPHASLPRQRGLLASLLLLA